MLQPNKIKHSTSGISSEIHKKQTQKIIKEHVNDEMGYQ